MAEIIKELYTVIPSDKISAAAFEGANIVLYTTDIDFFLNDKGLVREGVSHIKKRIELRPDPSITKDKEFTERTIRELIPAEAKVDDIIFDEQRSIVIIELEKPGLVIGKNGTTLGDIRRQTHWVPYIRRTPAIRSKIVENVRSVLFQESDYRRKFLNKVGERIYSGWTRGKQSTGWVRMTYLGSGRHVGRSCMLLQTPESRVLLDCGVDVGSQDEAYPMLECPDFHLNDIDAIIVSHAHIDHVGFLPYLFKYGYRGPVYLNEPTRDIMVLSLLDTVKIMSSSGKDPLYTVDDVKELVKHTICLNYEEVTDITPDIRITFYNSGHIIGSAMTHIHIGNGLHNILYTGDIKFQKTRLLDPAVTKFPRLETLMMEATYGGKDNLLPSREEAEEDFARIVKETLVENKGKVLVPVLGVGRAQEVMLLVDALIKEGRIPEVPVYIDGMVWDMTAIHTAYPEYLNATIRKAIFHSDENPFLSKHFIRVGSKKERTQIVEEGGPCVIIATSGMLVGGASVEYLKALANDRRHALLFLSYQGPGTLGRRIQSGERNFVLTINGERPTNIDLKMGIYNLDGFSGHAGRKELMSFVSKLNPLPKKILLNHGEQSRCLDLASSLHRQFKVETSAPKNLEAIRLR